MKAVIDWSEAPEDTTHYSPETDEENSCWVKLMNSGFLYIAKNHFDKNKDTPWIKANFKYCNLIVRPVATNIYTQAMVDSGVMPLVGMECMVINRKLAVPDWEKCTILFIGKFRVIYNSESCNERVGNVDLTGEVEFKPLDTRTDTEKAIKDLNSTWALSITPHAAKAILEAIKYGNIHGVTWSGK